MKDIGVVGSVGLAWLFNPVPLGINNRIIRPEYISKEEAEYMKERYPEYYSSISQNRYFKVDETRSNLWSTEQKEKVDRGALHFYAEKNNKELETAREIGGAVGTVAVMGWNVAKYSSAEKLEFNSENYTGSSNNFNEKPPLGLIEIDGIYQVPEYPTVVLKSGGSLVPVTNTNTSLVPFNPNASTGMSVTNLSSAGIIGGIVVPNLITSGKSVTTLEAPKNPVVKPVTKVEQNIETVKQSAVTSEKPKTVEKSHSQGSNNHNSNKESFNQKTEKNPNRNPAGENYGTEKTSNKMPPFSNRENIHRNSNTPNYDYKVQDNSGSNDSSNGDSGSKKNIEPSVEDSGKIYTLESQDANWNFKSEIPKTVVKNSEGNYTLGRGNEWSVGNEFENVSQNNNTSNYINRIINKDGTSNILKGTGYTTIDNRPYIENGKPKGRPSFRKDFPQKLYNQYNGVVQDPNTKEIINWKLGEPKKGIVDFGHKPDRKYSDIFYQEYLPEKWIPQQLRDWYNDPQNYQFEVPINNQGHKFE